MSTLLKSLPRATPARASLGNLPVNLFASVMGIAGLSIAWRQASAEYGVTPRIAEGVGIVALIVFVLLGAAYLAKAIKHPRAVVAEYRHPVAGNFFGTITIAILLLAAVVAPLDLATAAIMWSVGAMLTIALCFAIAGRLLQGKIDIAHAVPAWFIPGVATLDITVTGGPMPMAWAHELSLFALAVGTMIALLFFTMIMSRMIHHEPLPAAMVPSMLILMAPFAVGFLAYTSYTQRVDAFAGLLFYFGLFIFLALAPKVFRRGIPFASGWWAISFPMAALTSAALKYAAFAQAWPVTAIALALLSLLTLSIAVLFLKTLRILLNGKLLAG
ncbi:SLAC1 anion channel family protein [Achromobacter piechaudii]|uniref:Tellurite resistance protein TehA n=1 Tax=Achromobacter piechaudii TaxID=72556 RepID=A0A6S7CVB4_9BURK|nr:SLAC1 anion channel family protein [Achromobacter piechaudii]CAB3864073.1 Tellurite resistance protein TehA [Achromobacter piechaudii]